MKKSKTNNMMLVSPKSPYDLADIVRIMQKQEMSVLVKGYKTES